MKAKKRFWVSWYQPTEDYRPLTDPPNKNVLAWWCSGSRTVMTNGDERDEAILCAMVLGANECEVEKAVRKSWPEVKHWRFYDEVAADWLPGNRFPIEKEWERERLGLGKKQ